MKTRWVADLGNRYLKIGEVVDGELRPRHVLHATPESIDDGAFAPLGEPDGAVVYASVNPLVVPRWEGWLRSRYRVAALQLGRDRPFPIESRAEGAGADRLVNAIAAHALAPEGAVVVDIGTATTVDAVSPDGVFLGGAILPGPHLQAQALGDHAAQLFAVDPDEPSSPIGKTTREALQSGVFYGALGAVREVVARIVGALDFAPRLVVTGGDAPRFLAALDGATHVPGLTLEGVRIAGERTS